MFPNKYIALWGLLLLTACSNPVQPPLSVDSRQASSLEEASTRGARYLLGHIEEKRGWKADLLPTAIVIRPTIQQDSKQPLPIGGEIDGYIRKQAPGFPKLSLLAKGIQPNKKPHYLLHSSLAAKRNNSRDEVTLTLWAQDPRTQRTLATISSPVSIKNGVGATVSFDNGSPQTWAAALSQASQQLLETASKDRSWHTQLTHTQVLLAPLFDAFSSENLDLNRELLSQLQHQAKSLPRLKVASLSFSALEQAHYVIHAALATDKKSGGKLYQLDLWLRENPSGRLLAHSKSKVQAVGIRYELSPESKDSPVYVETPSASEGFNLQKQISQQGNYGQTIKISSLLADAATAYAQKQYARALEIYQMASGLPGGANNLRTHAGRYMALLRLNRKAEADKAFAELLKVGFSKSSTLTFKILFAVNSVEFAGGSFLGSQYQSWVGELASYLDNGKKCLQITGHSSNSGSDAYNLELSARRAAHIQQLMGTAKASAKQLTQTDGKGFHENIVGTGSDDNRDAVDRRVEFRKIGCR